MSTHVKQAGHADSKVLLGVVAIVILTAAASFMAGKSMAPKYAAPGTVPGGPNNPVVANVNGEEIYRSEIMASLRQMAPNATDEQLQQAYPVFLNQYVNTVLLGQAAADAGLESDQEVASTIEEARKQILRAAFLQDKFEGNVTDQAVEAMYQARVADQPDMTEIRARHILVETEEEANALIRQAKRGADFAQLAEENSTGPSAPNGGDIGYFVEGEMVPEFSDAAFAMEAGDISDAPVQTQFGWHVIKVEDKRTRTKPTLDEARAAIQQQIRQTIIEGTIRDLRADAEISLFDMNGDPYPETQEASPAAGEEEAPSEEMTEEEEGSSDETAPEEEAETEE